MSLKTFIPVVALLAIASGPPLGPPLGLRKPADGSQAIARRELRLGPQLLAPFAGVTLAAQSQPLTRRAANIGLLATYPSFYHMRPITVVGQLSRTPTGEMLLTDDKRQLRVVYSGSAPEGSAEVRGEFWDLGRMHSDDPRLASYDLRKLFQIGPDDPWPRAGQVTAIMANAIETAAPAAAASIRSVVLFPSRYLDTDVTITGQFAGRNLLGDLPDTPARSQYDFVLRSGDAAIWVTSLRPRGADFELSLETRIDTGRWVEVSGRVQQGRGLVFVEAHGRKLALAAPPAEVPVPQPIVPTSKAPPPEVIFSLPTQNESDVSWSAPVRIQFSRGLEAATLKDRIRVRYLEEEARALGEPEAPIAHFTVHYLPANNVVEIKFTQNLVRYRTVKVDLLEGILATDKQPLEPWTLTYVVGSH